MRLLFYLSGEHTGMAEAEVRALFETYHIPWRCLLLEHQVAIYEAEIFPGLSRLSMTHKILSVDFSLSKQPFRVRVKKLLSEADTLQLEREIADDLQKEYGRIPVDLENPEQEVYCILQKGKRFLGQTVMDFPYSYEGRKPHYRPYFHPSSVHPRIARTLVNLGRCSREVLDPFCGTGGILIEAGLMGLEVKGLDVSEHMVAGTRTNLEHFGIRTHRIFQGDATRLHNHFQEVESVVTDMPYGKASRLTSSRKQLYESAFESIRDVTKKACIVLSRPYDFERLGYEEREHFILHVHKSLDRHVYVLSVQ